MASEHRSQALDDLLSCRVAVITGKGGVGKTTVAAALALAASSWGRRTLLVELESREAFSKAFRMPPLDYHERQFRPDLWGLAADAEQSLMEYLDKFYGLKTIGKVLSRTNAIDFVTTGAPGLRDLLLVGKVYELERRKRDDGRPFYDLIVVDAPPTGRIVPFLMSAEGVSDVVRVGPIKNQSRAIVDMLRDPRRTKAFLVTLLEEMPVTETIEGVEGLRGAGITVGGVFANMVARERLTAEEAKVIDELGTEGLISQLGEVGVRLPKDTAGFAVDVVDAHRERIELQEEMRTQVVDRTDLTVIDLPLLTWKTFGEPELVVLGETIAGATGIPGPVTRGKK